MNKYQSISNIDTLNKELVVSSCVFLVKYKKLTPENFKEFVKEENKLFNSSSKDGFDMKKEDLLRYIRYLIKRVK
jgi:ribonucleotide reductase beta subunit family protein with ferritin-like domain